MPEFSETHADWKARLAQGDIFHVTEERARGRFLGYHLKHERLLRLAARSAEGVRALQDRVLEESAGRGMLADKAFALSVVLAEAGTVEARLLGTDLAFALVKILETKVPDEDVEPFVNGELPVALRSNQQLYYWLSHLHGLLTRLLAPPADAVGTKPEEYGPYLKTILHTQGGEPNELQQLLPRIVNAYSFFRFARAHAGDQYDAFSVMDYLADFANSERDESTRKAVVPHLFKTNRNHPIFIFLLRQGQRGEHLTESRQFQGDFEQALCDPEHPQRERVRQIVLKMAAGMDFSQEFLPLLFSRIGRRTTPYKGEFSDLDKIATDHNANRVVEEWLPDLEFVYGPEVRKGLALFNSFMKGYSPKPPALRPKSTLGLVDEFKGSHTYRELVEKVPGGELLNKTHLLDVEPDAERLREAREVIGRLKKDIIESQIALQSFRISIGDMRVSFQPVEPFPAHRIGVRRGDYFHQFYLNERLELESPEELLGMKGEMMEAVLVAGLHDFHPFYEVVPAESTPDANKPVRQPQGRPRSERHPRPRQPSRVLHGNNLLVISDQLIDPEHTALVATKGNGNSLNIHIDRRPHWADIVPAITRQARDWAWKDLESLPPLVQLDPIAKKMLQAALSHPDAHRLTTRKIFEDIIHSRRGKDLFSKDFSTEEMVGRFEELEIQYAGELQAEYEDLPPIPAGGISADDYQKLMSGRKKKGPLPRLFSIAQRKEEDKGRMQRAGVDYVVPDRMRSTQTYVPFERFTLEVPAGDQQKFRRIKNYIVVPGASAMEALTSILGLKVEA